MMMAMPEDAPRSDEQKAPTRKPATRRNHQATTVRKAKLPSGPARRRASRSTSRGRNEADEALSKSQGTQNANEGREHEEVPSDHRAATDAVGTDKNAAAQPTVQPTVPTSDGDHSVSPEADAARVERLAALGCPPDEIAGILGCTTEDLLQKHEKNFDRGRATGRAGLRRLLWKAAGDGKVTILIWLSRHWFESRAEARKNIAGSAEMNREEHAERGGDDDEGINGTSARRPLGTSDLLERDIIIERHIVTPSTSERIDESDPGEEINKDALDNAPLE